jgi:hypothetical protein
MTTHAAHSAYVWLKRTVTQPFVVPIGTVRRRGKSGSSVISDFVALRRSIFLCAPCVHKMPYRWMTRWEYAMIAGLHSTGTRCDSCQAITETDIFLPEEGGYFQEHLAVERHMHRTAAQRVLLQAGKRLT